MVSLDNEVPLFTEKHNAVVQFESTWNSDRWLPDILHLWKQSNFVFLRKSISDKGVPIPTQTDVVPANVDKTTTTQEPRHKTVGGSKLVAETWFSSFCFEFQTQTATSAVHGSSTVNEQRLADSLRGLADRMERELNVGTTTVFRFRDWFRSTLWCSSIWYCPCLPITNAAMPTTLCNSFVKTGRISVNFFSSCDHKAAVPFMRPITSNINEIKPDK